MVKYHRKMKIEEIKLKIKPTIGYEEEFEINVQSFIDFLYDQIGSFGLEAQLIENKKFIRETKYFRKEVKK